MPAPNSTPMQRFSFNLRRLKLVLKSWNKETFGLLQTRINKASSDLERIQKRISDKGFSDPLHQEEIEAHSNLDIALKQNEIHLKEKCRNKWLIAGDRNSSYFHQQFARHKSKFGIKELMIAGQMVTDSQHIDAHIIDYFAGLFSAGYTVPTDLHDVHNVIPCLVNNEDDNILTSIPIDDEIHSTVLAMEGSSAPGPDGFTGNFYKSFWSIIRDDLCLACRTLKKSN